MGVLVVALALVATYRLGRLRELDQSLELRFEKENAAFLERLRTKTT